MPNMLCLNRWSRRVVLGVVGLLAAQAAQAGYRNSFDPTAIEISQLPQVCQGVFRPELTKDPAYRMPNCGERFNHFCPALVAMNRASDPGQSRTDRRTMLNEFRDHLGYTIRNLQPNCPMAPYLDLMKVRLQFLETTLK